MYKRQVVPSPIQLVHSKLEYYSFIHYGMNTFTGREWGTGREDPRRYNPSKVDTDQWVRVLQESGSRGIVFTVKHHDGFCLYPSKYTEHSIANSPYKNGKGDIMRQLAESCRKYGMNSVSYTHLDVYKRQMLSCSFKPQNDTGDKAARQ